MPASHSPQCWQLCLPLLHTKPRVSFTCLHFCLLLSFMLSLKLMPSSCPWYFLLVLPVFKFLLTAQWLQSLNTTIYTTSCSLVPKMRQEEIKINLQGSIYTIVYLSLLAVNHCTTLPLLYSHSLWGLELSPPSKPLRPDIHCGVLLTFSVHL